MISAVIFDLDGVIVTTDDLHYEAWLRMAAEEGIPFDRAFNRRLRGVSRMESLALILSRAEKQYTEEEKKRLADKKNAYYVERISVLDGSVLMPGALETLKELRGNGIKTAIGSSSKNTPLILEKIGLAGMFDAVADGNQIVHSKPHPEVFLLAANKLGVPPQQCLVVEDADSGIEAAHAGNMKALGVGEASRNPKADLRAEDLAHIDLLKQIAEGRV